ncbi:hypothetical protein DICSQDRAFT_130619 [Dichomitus squalens LYAD-421 SS1]|uniref:DNA 3'-5' helicase n=1 Tax=Dichomitus squalens (strain LYAD-421) TaxID=732165 RepID=R7SI19_DICSQ|nr:uncharacterized protein DICSQDRAFT_130619 [Dichomitus squalens LYAD-421 SS1]EJF55380.1 hypothetical protein DICSQDRAFT_130619 [Dichomitus squalens LYAD-421 SS1]
MNIPFEVFSRDNPTITGQTPIILASLDATVRSYWRRAVAELRSDFQLNRLVVDEAHLLLTESTYRDVMNHVKELREHRVQMVLLSATIAPSSISDLRSQANLAKGLLTDIIRASSNRPELCFQTPVPYESFAESLDKITNRITSKVNSYKNSPHLRALVFVQRLAHGTRLARELGCDFYRGSSDDTISDAQREAMTQRWLSGHHPVMVATDAFGPGNDYPHVQDVFLVGSPRGVVDFLQMAGRGGRDGNRASIVVFSLGDTVPIPSAADRHVGRAELEPLIKNPHLRCWRSVFCKFLDGVEHRCILNPYDWLCPSCMKHAPADYTYPAAWMGPDGKLQKAKTLSPNLIPVEPVLSPVLVAKGRARAPSFLSLSSTTPVNTFSGATLSAGTAFDGPMQVSKKAREVVDMEDKEEVDRMWRAIRVFEGRCSVCQLLRPEQRAEKHAVMHCPVMVELLKQTNGKKHRSGDYLDWRSKIQYVKGTYVCYKCHIPFFHDRVHRAKVGKDKGCLKEHDDMVAPLVWAMYMDDGLRKWLEGRIGMRWGDDLEYRQWKMVIVDM